MLGAEAWSSLEVERIKVFYVVLFVMRVALYQGEELENYFFGLELVLVLHLQER